MIIQRDQPTFLIEGGGHLVCSRCTKTVVDIVKHRIDSWGKHKTVYKSIYTPRIKSYIKIKQLRKTQLEQCLTDLSMNNQIVLVCATDRLDMLTIKIRRIKYE